MIAQGTQARIESQKSDSRPEFGKPPRNTGKRKRAVDLTNLRASRYSSNRDSLAGSGLDHFLAYA